MDRSPCSNGESAGFHPARNIPSKSHFAPLTAPPSRPVQVRQRAEGYANVTGGTPVASVIAFWSAPISLVDLRPADLRQVLVVRPCGWRPRTRAGPATHRRHPARPARTAPVHEERGGRAKPRMFPGHPLDDPHRGVGSGVAARVERQVRRRSVVEGEHDRMLAGRDIDPAPYVFRPPSPDP